MSADDYDDFSRAILHKMIKEIAGAPIASRPAPKAPNLAAAGRP